MSFSKRVDLHAGIAVHQKVLSLRHQKVLSLRHLHAGVTGLAMHRADCHAGVLAANMLDDGHVEDVERLRVDASHLRVDASHLHTHTYTHTHT